MNTLLFAEWMKIKRQPATLFWGFLAVPLLSCVFRFLLEGLVIFRTGNLGLHNTDMLLSVSKGFGISGNPLGHLLYAIGIAALFSCEYRYFTWRHFVPRCSRLHLWAAKFAACLFCLSAGLLIMAVGDMLLQVLTSVIFEGALPPFPVNAHSVFALAIAFAIAVLELTALVAFVSTITILTRSMIAAATLAFFLAIGSSMLQIYVGSVEDLVPLPAFGAEALRSWLFAGAPAYAAWSGLGVLIVWTIVFAGFGALAFSRQELSAE